eukprot:2519500-Prymnesium_polylepis.1
MVGRLTGRLITLDTAAGAAPPTPRGRFGLRRSSALSRKAAMGVCYRVERHGVRPESARPCTSLRPQLELPRVADIGL